MSNKYFDWPSSPSRLVRFSAARSEDVNSALDGVSTALDGVEADMNSAIKLPLEPGVSNLVNLTPAQRAGFVLGFDSGGNVWAFDGSDRFRGEPGIEGPEGPRGPEGPPSFVPGPENHLSIGTVLAGSPGSASATIVGSYPGQTLNLVLPRGDQGDPGWTPVFAAVESGTKKVLQIIDWLGGVGSKPATGLYVGSSGLVADIADGVDVGGGVGPIGPANTLTIGSVSDGASASASITGTSPNQTLNLVIPKGDQGTPGKDGWVPVLAAISDGERRVQQVVDWTGGTAPKPATGDYVGPTGFVSLIGNATDIRGATGFGAGDVSATGVINAGELAEFADGTGNSIKASGKKVSDLVSTTDPRLYDSRAPTAHGHLISDVYGLQAELNSKGTSNLAIGTGPGDAMAGNTTIPAPPTWATITGKPAVIAAGFDQATARAVIGAGTSNLAIGTSGSTALAGDTVYGHLNIPQVSKSVNYTLVLSDAGKQIFHPASDTTARRFTIPSNASVAYPIGTSITFINENGTGGIVTIAINSDVLRLAGLGSLGDRTLGRNGIATAVKITSTSWIISGVNLA